MEAFLVQLTDQVARECHCSLASTPAVLAIQSLQTRNVVIIDA